MDSQTISTLDSNSDQNGFYRNYQKAWENVKYAGGHAGGGSSYKPTLGRLDAMEYAFNPLHASPTQSHTHRTGAAVQMRNGLFSEGYRDINEITLNADVAALYSRPDKPMQIRSNKKSSADMPLPGDLYGNGRRKFWERN